MNKSSNNLFYYYFLPLSFILMGIYGLLRDLRDVLWTTTLGFSSIGILKYISIIGSIFLLFFYQSAIKKKSILDVFFLINVFYAFFIAFSGFCFFCFEHKFFSNSLMNIFIILFYFLLEGLPIFLYGGMWNIIDYISEKKDVKEKYGYVTLVGQFGGFFFALCMYLCIKCGVFSNLLFVFFIVSILLLLTSLYAYYFKKNYHIIDSKNSSLILKSKITFSESFLFFIKNFYALGIFALVFFWEIINGGLNFFRLKITMTNQLNVNNIIFFGSLCFHTMITYFIGICLVMIGTHFLIKFFGIKKTLLIIPFVLLFLIIALFFFSSQIIILGGYIFIRSFYYALIYPLKEALWLIFDKKMRISLKSWVDSFGSRFGKVFIATYISLMYFFFGKCSDFHCAIIFLIILILWFLVSYFLGKKYEN